MYTLEPLELIVILSVNEDGGATIGLYANHLAENYLELLRANSELSHILVIMGFFEQIGK